MMGPNSVLYELNIYTSTCTVTVLGDAGLQKKFNEWYTGTIEGGKLYIEGFEDSSDSKPFTACFDPDIIHFLTIRMR